MTECKHEWRLILDDTGGAFRFCSICEQSENEWMNAKPKQCKDCKWFEMSREGDGAPGYGSCNMAWAWEVELPRAMFADGGGILYVLPTHGCNGWEKKE